MSASGRLLVKPRVCDRCGRCLRACPLGALRVGRSYIMVDWARCDACGRCVRACGTGALALAGAAAPTAGTAPRAAVPAYRRREPVARGAAESAARASGACASGTARPAGAVPKAAHAADGEPFAWSLLEAAATLSVTFSAFMAKEALLASRVVAALPPARLVPLRSGVLAVYYALQLALLWWLVRRRGGSFSEAFSLVGAGERGSDGWLRSAGLVAAGLVLTRVLATGYGLLTQRLGLMPAAGTDTVTRVFGTAPAGLALAVVMLVFVGPFVEELVFRGALQRGLESRFGVWPAIVAQALLFAAFHRSWWLLVPMTLLGVALGWLARRRRSLWPPIALHALYNALSVAAVLAAVSAAR